MKKVLIWIVVVFAGMATIGSMLPKPTPEEQRKIDLHAIRSATCGDFRAARPHRYDWTADEMQLAEACRKLGY